MDSSLWHSYASSEGMFYHVLNRPADLRKYGFAFPFESKLPFHLLQKRSSKAVALAEEINDTDPFFLGTK